MNRWRSASVGSQVWPSGGPNFAQVLSSRAIAVVVNFASSECEAARGGVVKARNPKSTSIALFLRSNSSSHVRSRSEGWNTTLAGRPSRAGTVSSLTCRSLALLQPQ